MNGLRAEIPREVEVWGAREVKCNPISAHSVVRKSVLYVLLLMT